MNIVLVYNPRSGSTPGLSELRAICKRHGIEIKTHIAVSNNYQKKLKPYIKKDQIIVVVGGDGTISSVASLLMGTRAILAPIPGGTLNHFTKDLNVPQDPDEAVAKLVRAKPRMADVASVNDVIFINNSSIGLYPSSLQTREKLEDKKLTKWSAAILASVRAFVKYRTYTVTIGDETFKTPFLFVGNNDYHLTDSADGRKHLDDGILSVYTIVAASRLELIRTFAQTIFGQQRKPEELKTWKTAQITIHTKRSHIRVSRDGELEKLTTPLTYKSQPKSLRVLS